MKDPIIDVKATDATGSVPDSKSPTRPYPMEREVAEYIASHDPGWTITQDDLSRRLGVDVTHRDFAFKMMTIRNHLAKEGVYLWTERGSGIYRVLSEEEKVTHEGPRIERVMLSAIHRHRELISTVDVSQLSDDARKALDRQQIRNGFLLTAYRASRRADLNSPDALKRLLEAGAKEKP